MCTGLANHQNVKEGLEQEWRVPKGWLAERPCQSPLGAVGGRGIWAAAGLRRSFHDHRPVWLPIFYRNNPSFSKLISSSMCWTHLTGDALYWLQWVFRPSPTLSWLQFKKDVLICFGDNSTPTPNYYGTWGLAHQSGLVGRLCLVSSHASTIPRLWVRSTTWGNIWWVFGLTSTWKYAETPMFWKIVEVPENCPQCGTPI